MTLAEMLPAIADMLAHEWDYARLMDLMDCKYVDMERWFSCGIGGM